MCDFVEKNILLEQRRNKKKTGKLIYNKAKKTHTNTQYLLITIVTVRWKKRKKRRNAIGFDGVINSTAVKQTKRRKTNTSLLIRR